MCVMKCDAEQNYCKWHVYGCTIKQPHYYVECFFGHAATAS